MRTSPAHLFHCFLLCARLSPTFLLNVKSRAQHKWLSTNKEVSRSTVACEVMKVLLIARKAMESFHVKTKLSTYITFAVDQFKLFATELQKDMNKSVPISVSHCICVFYVL